MAKVSYLDFPPGYEDMYKKALQAGDRFAFSRVRVRDIFLSRARVKGITQKSQMVALAPVWASFAPTTKDAWNSAGLESGLTGWKQFVVDTTERRKAGLDGYAAPQELYQSKVGRMVVESPATALTIEQMHPLTYFVQRKVTGTRSQYQPVEIDEPFSLPLEISISWKTDLVAAGDNPRARFYCVVYSSYQGRTIETPVEINFGLNDDWQRASASLSSVVGLVRSYSAFIEIHDARGNLYFDNVSILHNSENWARDPACNNVSQAFTKAFYQVARHWVAVDVSEGTDFGSFYFDTLMPTASPIYQAKVHLTSAQLATLHSVPVVIVSAPGANKALLPLRCAGRVTYGAPEFSGSPSLDVQLNYASFYTDPLLVCFELLGYVEEWLQPFSESDGYNERFQLNDPLILNVPIGDPGTNGSSLDVILDYIIYDFS